MNDALKYIFIFLANGLRDIFTFVITVRIASDMPYYQILQFMGNFDFRTE